MNNKENTNLNDISIVSHGFINNKQKRKDEFRTSFEERLFG